MSEDFGWGIVSRECGGGGCGVNRGGVIIVISLGCHSPPPLYSLVEYHQSCLYVTVHLHRKHS